VPLTRFKIRFPFSFQILKPLLSRASAMELDYYDHWTSGELTVANRQLEQTTNIRTNDVNTEEVVLKYRSREEELMKTKRDAALSKLSRRRLQSERAAAKTTKMEASKSKRGLRAVTASRTRAAGRREAAAAPYTMTGDSAAAMAKVALQMQDVTEEQVLKSLQLKMTRGIPDGVVAKDYIKYRKCKYIEDIR
jgi:hypothetical protein